MSKKLMEMGYKALKEQKGNMMLPNRYRTRANPMLSMPSGGTENSPNKIGGGGGGGSPFKFPSRERALNFGLKKKQAGKAIQTTAIGGTATTGTRGYQEFTDDITNAIPGVEASPPKFKVFGVGFGGRENQGKLVGAVKDTALEMKPKEYKALTTDPVTTRVILPNIAKDIAKNTIDTAGNIGTFVTTGGVGSVAKRATGAGNEISKKAGEKVKELLKPKTIEPFLKPRDYESLGQTTKKFSKNVADRFGLDVEKAKKYAGTVQDFIKTKTYDL